MRHTGLQLFKDIDVSNDAKINKANIIDKLSIPIRRSVDTNTFSDLFIENDELNQLNYYNNIIAVLDLNNPDALKSLLLSEIVFDDFFNFNKSFVESGSFHTIIKQDDIDSNQLDINLLTDCTCNQDITSVPSINIHNVDVSILDKIYYNLSKANANNIPINTNFIDSTNKFHNHMVFYDNILYSPTLSTIYIYLDSTENELVLIDITNVDIIEIDFKVITISSDLISDTYQELPNHYHKIKDLSNLDEHTNNLNGFQRFINNNQIKFDFDQDLFVNTFKLKNSFFEKRYNVNLLNKKLFNVNLNILQSTTDLKYDIKEIDLGGGNIVYEYHFSSLNFEADTIIELSTTDNQTIYNEKLYSISDTTQHDTQYLVEILKFDYNLLISSNTVNKTDVIDIYYEQIDKTSIDDNIVEIYKINDQTVYTINAYQDIEIIQSNINTIPYSNISKHLLYRDIDKNIIINIPKEYNGIEKQLDLTLINDSDFYITFDTTNVVTQLDIYQLDIFTDKQEFINSYDISDSNKKLTLPRGRVKFINSNELNRFNITLFDRTQ